MRANTWNRFKLIRHFVGVVALSLLAPLHILAATVTWDAGAGDQKWTSNTNWSDNANGVVTGDTAVFNDTAVGTSLMDETSPFSLNSLVVTNTSGTQTIDLQGNQLNVGTTVVGRDATGSAAVFQNGTYKPTGDVYLYVGRRDSAATADGTLVIGTPSTTTTVDASATTTRIFVGDNGANGLLVLTNATFNSAGSKTLRASEMHLGRAYGYARTGRVILPEADKLTNILVTGSFTLGLGGGTGQLGSATSPERLPDGVSLQFGLSTASRLGSALVGRGGWGNPGTGRLVMGSNSTFTAYANQLWIGWSDTGGSTEGILDLREAAIGAGGTFDVNDLRVGNGRSVGRLLFSSTTGLGQLTNLYVNSTLHLGRTGAGPVGRIGTGPTGDGDLPAGLNLRFGVSPSSRAEVMVGWEGDAPGSNGRMSLGLNSTFQGYVTNLYVGRPTQGYHVSYGVLDLRNGTLTGGGLDVNGVLEVGVGAGNGSGALYLGPSPSASIVAKSPLVLVGGTGGAPVTGLLETFGTVFQVTGTSAKSLDIRANGDIVTHVSTMPSGFDILDSNASVFNIDAGGLYTAVFENDPLSNQPWWGLRMAGNNTNLFSTLVNGGRLTWDATALSPSLQPRVGVYYDAAGSFTYLGLQVPEPSTLLLLALGGAIWWGRSRRPRRLH